MRIPRTGKTLLRGFQLVSMLAALACTAASCGPHRSTLSGPKCAFADPQFTSSLAVANLIAEYYVAHHEWPLTRTHLEEQHRQMLEREKEQMSAAEFQELSALLDSFTSMEFRKSGRDLVFHYRFKIGQTTTDQTVTFRPRPTTDEILEAATAKGYD